MGSAAAPFRMTVMVMRVNREVGKGRKEHKEYLCACSHTQPELETAFQSLKFAEVSKEAADPKHLRGPKVA